MHMPGQAPGWLLVVIAGAVGLAVGSYLTVLATRVPAGASMLGAPGRCPACGARPRVAGAIPLVGGLLRRGRCRGCAGATGAWRPAVELGTGALFAVMTLRFGFSPVLPAFWLLAALAVVLAVVDLAHRRLPDQLTLPAYPAAAALLGAAALAIPGGGRDFCPPWLAWPRPGCSSCCSPWSIRPASAGAT